MTANVGSIEYDVIADTSGLLKAEKAVDKSTNAMVQDFSRIDKAAKKTSTQISKTSKAVSKGMSGMGRNAGQAGIQVQQLVGQIQGGQNVMQAFAAQSADLGIVLGAPLVGVIASLTFALGGALAPALFSSNSAMEELEETVERLKAVITLSSGGVAEYSTQMEQLAIISEQLVKTQIGIAIAEQNKAFKQSANVLNDATKEATSFLNVFGSFDEVVKDLTGKKLGEEGFNEARSALLNFKREVAEFNIKPTVDGADSLSESINRLAKAGGDATESGRELLQLAIDQVSLFQQGKITLDQLNASLEKNGTTSSIVASKVKDMSDALTLQAETLGFTDRALALHTAFLNSATQAEFDAINAAFDKIEAHDAETEAIKRKSAAEKKAVSERKSLSGQVKGVAAGLLDPQEKLLAQLILRQTTIDLAHEQEIIKEKEFLELKRRANEDYVNGLKALDEKALGNTGDQLAKLGISWEAMGVQAAGALTGIATGAMTGQEAMRGLAMTILNQLVGALITMGIQAIIGQTTATAAGVASAATLATAYAPAAAMVSLASFGANAAPAAAGIASTLALTQGAALAGGRQFGGPVNANSAYRVGEAGPEIFQTQSGQNIMIPGENGKVLSNGDSMGALGGGPMEVVVNNYGAPMDVSVNQNDRQITIDLTLKAVANQINNNQGSIPKALKNSSNYQPKANR